MANENKNKRNNPNNQNDPPGLKRRDIIILIITLVCIIGSYALIRNFSGAVTKEINYSNFYNSLNKGEITSFSLDQKAGTVKYELKNDKTEYFTYVPAGDIQNIYETARSKNIPNKVVKSSNMLEVLLNLGGYLIPLIFFFYIFKSFSKIGGGKGGIMGLGKNTAKLYEQKTGITFKDVAGQEEAKESVLEIVDFLHNPQKYTAIGAKLPKGALLVGPPGTGKTLLAKAVAGEADVPFFSQSGSAFVEMFVGMGAGRVRDLFKEAEEKAPCIIFIDEIDAIGKSRDSGLQSNDEREQTLNQLLAEMDGFDSTKGIVIFAATNRPEVLDKALLRPGRFDRRIIVDAPDLKGREEILKVHAKDVKIGDDVNLVEIAKATPGAVGADLANIINEGALNAVKNGRQFVKQEDLMEAIEVVIAGQQKKNKIMSPKEKRIVAFHEIGHALVAALQKNTDPVLKITIIPRTMGSLGYTMQVPTDDKYLLSKEEMLQEISILLGGRSAEEVEFGSITTGASNDIERATNMARKMVSIYGMSDKFDMMALESMSNQYLDGRLVSNVSNETQTLLDQEVSNIIRTEHERARKLLEENKELLTILSEKLLEKETLTGAELVEIIRQYKGEDSIKVTNDLNQKKPTAEVITEGVEKVDLNDQNTTLEPPKTTIDEEKANE